MKNSENTKRNTKRTVIAVLICLAVFLAVILAITVACSGEDNEEISNQSVNMVMDGSSSESSAGSQSESTQEPSDEPFEAVSEESFSDKSDESEPEQSEVSDESEPLEGSSAESDEPSQSEQSKPFESSQPEATSKPNETSQPNQPVDTKEYHTEWGTRPFEFEEPKDSIYFGMYGSPYSGAAIEEHIDRYNNVWYTLGGKVLGNGSIFYTGKLLPGGDTKYWGYGYWSNGSCWWNENGETFYSRTIYPSVNLYDESQKFLGTPDDMTYGTTFVTWWMFFEGNDLGARSIALQCDSFEGLFAGVKEYMLQCGEDFYEDWKEDYEDALCNENLYAWLNINSYEDLIKAIIDPFSYKFSNYTHKF